MENNIFHTYFDLASEIFPEKICHYGLLDGVGRNQSKKIYFSWSSTYMLSEYMQTLHAFR